MERCSRATGWSSFFCVLRDTALSWTVIRRTNLVDWNGKVLKGYKLVPFLILRDAASLRTVIRRTDSISFIRAIHALFIIQSFIHS